MPYCQLKKVNMYYEEIGSGTPIVMIHGFSPDHRLMKGCMEPIFQEKDGYRRIYLDLPGMGQTKDYETINNTDEMLEAVMELIEKLIPGEDFLLAGQSYGGYMIRGIITKMPERVLGAALICPMIVPDHADRTLPQHKALQVDENFLATLTKEEREDFLGINVRLNEHTWKRYSEEVVSGLKIADYEFLAKIEKNYGYTFEVDQVEFAKPMLFITGRQDHITGYKDVYDILDNYPRATFSVIDVAGHNLHIDQQEILNLQINEWMDRVNVNRQESTPIIP
ncbi:alpha/beta fold hydrolase [Fictibacillus barbaricus]|uniref:Pimeloyl-ACP methyl ester carboxylesterase n=1 Tax=Fictibacillus barbaricus TaxID=182136 RepID=A0ABU1TWT7_9BACL|nr:alpha/beta hydrolase [Fictibacillus barbaricus]MDR7071673.1 pimeloyl-ACP methyl ester carboxylesterase [Fictibacillus barbaricus]